jgi:hypothetical protein
MCVCVSIYIFMCVCIQNPNSINLIVKYELEYTGIDLFYSAGIVVNYILDLLRIVLDRAIFPLIFCMCFSICDCFQAVYHRLLSTQRYRYFSVIKYLPLTLVCH